MSGRLIDRIPFAKIVMVLAIVFGISLGLCGVTFVLSSGGGRGGGFFVGLGVLELVALGVSIAGLLLTLLVFVTLSIFGGFSEKVSQSTISSEEGDDRKID
jgi:membrane protein implicated in regulation of membrane protease activity